MRDSFIEEHPEYLDLMKSIISMVEPYEKVFEKLDDINVCLLYTSDAADERSSVDLGGRSIIKKKTHRQIRRVRIRERKKTEEQQKR